MTQQQALLDIGDGYQATRQTLKIMADVVRQASTENQIRALAVSLSQTFPNKAFFAEVAACFQYVRDNIRYIQNPIGFQRLEYPTDLLQTGSGACADMCTLLAAMLHSIGHPTRFCAVGYIQPGQCEHVYLETKIGSQWFGLDPTEPVEVGWVPVRPYVNQDCTCMIKERI
jgi:transglutaminase-like putative cysteine protease